MRVRLPGEDQEKLVRRNQSPPHQERLQLNYLRAVVLDGLKPEGPSSLETNLVVTEILDSARQSVTTGTTIHLKP